MEHFTIFVVEDDKFYGQLLSFHLTLNPDYKVELFSTGSEALKNLHKNPAIITIDYSLPDMKGDFLMKKVLETNPDTAIIIISGQEDVGTAVKLLKEGAWEYITKDDETKDRLWNTVKNIRQNHSLKQEIQDLRSEVSQKYSFNNAIKGRSQEIKRVFALMEKAADSKITVTITGETGTGKELAAKAIHYSSERKKKPFIAINVSAIPHELIESEFFGFEKGSFTGAYTRKIGKFDEANGGTLFLDEIGEMELNMQAKLLRVLQEKEFTRIGGNQLIKTDFRLIVATNRNLAEMVKSNNFREDLYYRLLGLPVHLPPLRERNNDILILANFFIAEYCKENGLDAKWI
ncbi:MAG: sigma-54 dependent transcriptional regulator [Salinivirgaceae bacterium]|nr:sigma-54 dependent transcriptional regulator [Salinivirgaceae bacterium]